MKKIVDGEYVQYLHEVKGMTLPDIAKLLNVKFLTVRNALYWTRRRKKEEQNAQEQKIREIVRDEIRLHEERQAENIHKKP